MQNHDMKLRTAQSQPVRKMRAKDCQRRGQPPQWQPPIDLCAEMAEYTAIGEGAKEFLRLRLSESELYTIHSQTQQGLDRNFANEYDPEFWTRINGALPKARGKNIFNCSDEE